MKQPEQNGLIFGFEEISAKKVNYLWLGAGGT